MHVCVMSGKQSMHHIALGLARQILLRPSLHLTCCKNAQRTLQLSTLACKPHFWQFLQSLSHQHY